MRIPGSKSYTNRALIMAAYAKGVVRLRDPLYSDDTQAMVECLRALGLRINVAPDALEVVGDIGCIRDQHYVLNGIDSGTTVRFLLPLLCIVPGVKILTGNPRLRERPIRDLVDALRSLGAEIRYCETEGQLPVEVSSSSLTGSFVLLKGDVSSQFCSGLLLTAPYFREGLNIQIVGRLISKPYVDMTIHCMREWGVEVAVNEGNYRVASKPYDKTEYGIEGDFSSAAYFFAMAVMTQSTVFIENLNPRSYQADRKFLRILEQMGNVVIYEEQGVRLMGKQIVPLEVDMEDCPDQVMTLAVIAAFARGVTKISGVRSLRVKETERVIALKNELGRMGIRTEDTADTLTIYGGDPVTASIHTYNDHRMAMAFAVAKKRLPDLEICEPEVVSKTFPTFWELWKTTSF